LQNNPSVTLATQIGVVWYNGGFNGGSAVIDYRIWYDNATNGASFTVLQSNVTWLNYTAT